MNFIELYNFVLRFAFPILACALLWRCGKSLLQGHQDSELWAWLVLPSGDRLAVTHWENLIGRHKSCDIPMDYPTVSRNHAVLTRYDDGSWTIGDVASKGGIQVNGVDVNMKAINHGDVISMGGVACTFLTALPEEQPPRVRVGREIYPSITLLYLTMFQMLALVLFLLQSSGDDAIPMLLGFGGLLFAQWGVYLAFRITGRTGFEVETLAFFLTTMGFLVIASSDPQELPKQLISLGLGMMAFFLVGWSLRNLVRAKRVRYLAAVAGLGLLAFNLLFGSKQFGAQNWIYIGSMSFQPSELVKICFVFVGASTLDRLMTKRNLFLFLIYSGIICGCLGLMNDFGTAIIFFVAFLFVAFFRSGDFAKLALISAGTAFGGFTMLRFRPHAIARFSNWGNVWNDPLDGGFQQTRAMMCMASGGLFGLGAGRGWLKYVAAADTDLVFAFVTEEWGLIVALTMVAAIVLFSLFVIKSSMTARSSFYTISAVTATGIFTMQVILNVFGTVDILPLTGITFPFVSNGGSSMIASWGLLAFIKSADTRKGGSFVVGGNT